MKVRGGQIMRMGSMVLVTLLLGVFVVVVTPATAGTYLGELCWSSTFTQDQTGPITPKTGLARMGVAAMGGNYFTLQGTVTTPGAQIALDGGITLFGSQVLMTLAFSVNQSASDPYQSTGIISMTLNTSDLGGTIFMVGTGFNPTSKAFLSKYFAGTVAFTTCP